MNSELIYKNLKYFLHKVGQPLAKMPNGVDAVVSDLFIWRRSTEWRTDFELLDISNLLGCSGFNSTAKFVFFDATGGFLYEQEVSAEADRRKTIDVADLIEDGCGEYGTFAVFRLSNPQDLQDYGSYLTDRGYLRYRYRQASINSYVHGNCDSISRNSRGEIKLLGGTSFLRRKYNLQYLIEEKDNLQFAVVNNTAVTQRINFAFYSEGSNKPLNVPQTLVVNPIGMGITPANGSSLGRCRLVISSRMVMARPIVFSFQTGSLDVFHG